MILSLRFLVCLFFVCAVLCQEWKGSRPFYESSDPNKKTATHINVDTGIVHNFAALSDRIIHRTYRTKFDSAKTICEVQQVSSMDSTNTKHIAAFGDQDEQIIVLVFAAPRGRGKDTTCNSISNQGCSEIFIMESIDEGATWSKPMVVNRTKQDDVFHRTAPSVAYDRETSTIYIAYTLAEVPSNKSVIGLIKKTVGGKYTEEMRVYLGYNYYWLNPKLTITNPRKRVGYVHMSLVGTALRGSIMGVFYTQSINNGESWSSPRDMISHDHNSVHETAIGAVGAAGIEELYIAFTSFSSSVMYARSDDNGKKWTYVAKVSQTAGRLSALRACGQVATLGVLVSIVPKDNPNTIELSYYNTTTKTWSQFPKPFKSVDKFNGPVAFDCTGLLTDKVAFTAVTDQGSAAVFDTFNYDYPEIE